MKAVVAAFNQEKALVGAFSMITNLRMELFEALIHRSNLRHLGAVVECVEASVAGVRRHPLAQPAALLALAAVLVAVGGRQIAAVTSTITLKYRICESNQRTECVVASVGGCGGQTGAEAAALLAVLGDVGLGSWRILRSAVPASA